MVKNKEEIINVLSSLVSADGSDEALSLLEDVSDTLDSLLVRPEVDWERRYNELREKYIARFSGAEIDAPRLDENEDAEEENLTYEKLFKIEKEEEDE